VTTVTTAPLPTAPSPEASGTAAAAAERAARQSYGRLLAHLAWRWRDIAAAEDALAEAFAAALDHWPRTGVPDAPDAWLMTAAKRNLLQAARHQKVVDDPAYTVLLPDENTPAPDPSGQPIPDDRLKLLFVCAHPAIDAAVRTPLMLQTVLGLDAQRIASAFLVSPAAMAQRLVRAKAKIARAGIRFEEPEARELPERTHAVLEAIYAAYTVGSDSAAAPDAAASDLTDEALYLADLAATLLPGQPEAAGLLALLLLCEARRGARFDETGAFVPLHQQDTARWHQPLIQRADQILWVAAARGAPGPFQLEAAIQAAHCHRAFTGGPVPWAGIAQLYAQLVAHAPTVGALVSQAVAVGESSSPGEGIALLDALAARAEARTLDSYQPYWAARAHLLARAGRAPEARDSYTLAIGLTTLPAVRHHLQKQIDKLLFL
jgi:RNA polymerase sigma-70 factor, ECF subfamily